MARHQPTSDQVALRTAVTIFATAVLYAHAAPADAQVVDSKFELFVTDPSDSIRFYTALGFSVVHAKADGYSTLRSGHTVVALSPVPWWLPLRLAGFVRYPPIGTELVFYTNRLNELHAELVKAGYSPGSITLQPWGDRDFRLTDPDGYYIRVSEGHSVPESAGILK